MMKADVGQAATYLLRLTGSEQNTTLMSQQEMGKWVLEA